VAIGLRASLGVGVIREPLGHARNFPPERAVRNKIPPAGAVVFVIVPGANAEISGDNEEAYEEETTMSIFGDIVVIVMMVPVLLVVVIVVGIMVRIVVGITVRVVMRVGMVCGLVAVLLVMGRGRVFLVCVTLPLPLLGTTGDGVPLDMGFTGDRVVVDEFGIRVAVRLAEEGEVEVLPDLALVLLRVGRVEGAVEKNGNTVLMFEFVVIREEIIVIKQGNSRDDALDLVRLFVLLDQASPGAMGALISFMDVGLGHKWGAEVKTQLIDGGTGRRAAPVGDDFLASKFVQVEMVVEITFKLAFKGLLLGSACNASEQERRKGGPPQKHG